MKSLIYQSTLFFHIIAGILALTTGIIAMFARKKGGNLHNKTGLVFYYAMAFIFISTLIFFVLDPVNLKYQFFLGIGIVSFYPVYTGRSVLYMKKGLNAGAFAKALSVAAMTCALLMILFGNFGGLPTAEQILFNVFGTILLFNGMGDAQVYFGFKPMSKNYWLMAHIGKMLGGYSAALTAFMVNVVPRYIPENTSMYVFIATWTLPALVLGVYSAFVKKKYSPKMKRQTTTIRTELEYS